MMQYVEFVFSGFWTWLGTVFIICIPGLILVEVIKAIFNKNSPSE